MKKLRVVRAIVAGVCAAAIGTVPLARALDAQTPSRTAVDLTLGRQDVNGGIIDGRTGLLLDLTLARRMDSSARSSLVLALGGSGVVGKMDDSCLLLRSGSSFGGGCAPGGNFLGVSALGGADRVFGRSVARVLLGPTLLRGEHYTIRDPEGSVERTGSATFVGIQGRVDLAHRLLGGLGVGVMFRTSVVRSRDGVTLVTPGGGLSLTYR